MYQAAYAAHLLERPFFLVFSKRIKPVGEQLYKLRSWYDIPQVASMELSAEMFMNLGIDCFSIGCVHAQASLSVLFQPIHTQCDVRFASA